MLPRLEAEEALLMERVVSAGTGSLKPSYRTTFLRELARTASAGRRARRPASLAEVAAAGIKVERVPVKSSA